jgi:hypothetical protein
MEETLIFLAGALAGQALAIGLLAIMRRCRRQELEKAGLE